MDKIRQRTLTHWLKEQGTFANSWLHIAKWLGFFNALVIVTQAWLISLILNDLIIAGRQRSELIGYFVFLLLTIIIKVGLIWCKEWVGFHYSYLTKRAIRRKVLNKLQELGPAWIQNRTIGSWSTIVQEQIEEMHDYYARYLPQMFLATIIPVVILITIFPVNWAAGLILFITAPLVPLFMALVGMGAADANRRNFIALRRLSGYFLDRLRGMDTIRVFARGEAEAQIMQETTKDFRQRTMEVLRLAFLSSAVLEFFASISIAIVAVYFGFSYLGQFHFGSYGLPITLASGFLALILAPEFFQPLRDLGTFYHAKAQAVGAADVIVDFLSIENKTNNEKEDRLKNQVNILIKAKELEIYSSSGQKIAGPLNFTIYPGTKIAIIGKSGAGKSSLLNTLLGFLPYKGSLKINGVELSELSLTSWRRELGWIGQNPHLPERTIRDNILLGHTNATHLQLQEAIHRAHVNEFLSVLPNGLDTTIGDNAAGLSVGQAQRIALARLILKPHRLLLLDEPTASLDAKSEKYLMQTLLELTNHKTTLFVTHRIKEIKQFDVIWVMEQGKIIQSGSYSELSQKPGVFSQLLSNYGKDP